MAELVRDERRLPYLTHPSSLPRSSLLFAHTNSLKGQEIVLPERKARKSVAFSEGTTIMDENGDITAGGEVEERTTAERHSSGSAGTKAPPLHHHLPIFKSRLVSDNISEPAEEPEEAKPSDEVDELFKGLSKKKKPSKKVKDAEASTEPAEEAPVVADGEFDPSALKKKKKKPKKADVADFEAKLAEAGVGEDGEEKPTTSDKEALNGDAGDLEKGTGIWAHDSTAPISYQLLLSRFFTQLHNHHPDLLSSGSKSYKIPPPQCLREGNKKTIFANISEICKRMKRSDEHVTQFLFAELGTSGSVDGSRRLVIKGRFQQKQIENVLRRYIGVS
jgi:translation initiation factor 2 subunit 2